MFCLQKDRSATFSGPWIHYGIMAFMESRCDRDNALVEKDKVSVILSYIAPACQTAERKANGLDFSLFIMDLFFDTSLYCPWSYGSASNNSVSAF